MSYLTKENSVIGIQTELIIIQSEIYRLENMYNRLEKKYKETSYSEIHQKMELFKQLKYIKKELEENKNIEVLLKKYICNIENAIKNLNNLPKEVFYMHRYLGKSLIEIAEELGYDYDYIRHVSAKADKIIDNIKCKNS